ncbi:MAG: hypothetical protein RLN95_11580, partial [Nitratireductor sp.]
MAGNDADRLARILAHLQGGCSLLRLTSCQCRRRGSVWQRFPIQSVEPAGNQDFGKSANGRSCGVARGGVVGRRRA